MSLAAAIAVLVLVPSPAANAANPPAVTTTIAITEVAYGGKMTGTYDGEYVEFTNISCSPVNMGSYYYSDTESQTGDVSLSGLGTLAPGQSAVITDAAAADFRTEWNLASSVVVVQNTSANLNSTDSAFLFTGGVMVDKYPGGTVTSKGQSAYRKSGALGSYTSSAWTVVSSTGGDGAVKSVKGSYGSPGSTTYNKATNCSGGGTGGTDTITPAYAALPAAIGDSTNPTMAITLSSGLSSSTVTGSSSNTSIASAVSVSGTGASRTVTVTPGSTEGIATITLTAGSVTTTFQYGLTRNQNNSSQRWYAGAGNLSTAVDAGDGYFWAGDDEQNVLHLYDAEHSGEPVASFDIAAAFGTTFSEEIDIEASARVGNTIYWSGSMSNKNGGDESAPRNTLFATTISGTGASSTLAKTGSIYTGLRAALKSFDSSNTYGLKTGFTSGTNGHDPSMANLEGIEFAPGSTTTAYLAFRGPIKSSKALIVPVTNFPSLVTGSSPSFGTPFWLNVGSGYGIREIRKNAADQYLIVSGLTVADGSGYDNAGFKLFTWDGQSADAPVDTAVTIPQMPVGMTAATVGAYEAIVEMPADLSGGTVRLVQDDGDTTPYGTGNGSSKDGTLSGIPALQKDLGLAFTLPTTSVPLSIDSISGKSATVGTAIAGFSASAAGGTSPYTFSATGLPAGLTLSSAGAFSGTPTADGSFNVTVTATDAASATASTSFTYTVAKGALSSTPSPTISGSAVVGGTVTAVPGAWDSGVSLTYTWYDGPDVIGTGVTSPVFTSDQVGDDITVKVTGSKVGYNSVTKTSPSVTVGAGPLAATVIDDKSASVGTAISGFSAGASGGTSPYTFSATGLPTGVSLSAAGAFSGTPSHAGTFDVTVTVTDSADATATTTFVYSVAKGAQAIGFTSDVPVDAAVHGSYEVTATGGDSGSPVTFSSGTPAVCSVTGSTVSFLAAGTCDVLADQAGSADYDAAEQVTQRIVVGGGPSYAYVNENAYGGTNRVATYRVASDGTSTLVGTYETGHPGSAGGWYAGAKAALVQSSRFLFVLNLGDQTVTTFSVDPEDGRLALVGTTPSLDGLSSGSLAVNPAGTVLYTGALSGSGSDGLLISYAIGNDGVVDPTPLASVNVEADGLSVSPDGTQLAVAAPHSGVRVYATGADGHLTEVAAAESEGSTDVRWLDAETLVVGSNERGSIGFYALTEGGLDLVDSVETPTGYKWSQAVAVGPDGVAYIGTSEGIRSAKVVDDELVLGPVASVPLQPSAGSDWITSIAVTGDGKHLLVGAFQDGWVYQYEIGEDTGAGPSLTYQHAIAVNGGLPTITTFVS